jgi:sugar phosphate isomerase/epimerase
MASRVKVGLAKITLSTSSVFPESTESAFEIASILGYDGVEVMVGTDAASQSLDELKRLRDVYSMPVLSIHAPCLLVTQRVWGIDPWGKLTRAREVAEELGADTVVVHPPFRWQRDYGREFVAGLNRMTNETHVQFAVENMFPWRARSREVMAYSPGWDIRDEDYPATTLDLSHTAVSGTDALKMARDLGDRLTHVHLADGSGSALDEHLIPGRGTQACVPVLSHLLGNGFAGSIVLEVSTRKASSQTERMTDLAEALAFARLHSGSAP